MIRNTSEINIGLIQMQCSEDVGANLEKAYAYCEKLAQDGADVICLPELFQSRYFCQTEDASLFALAEYIPGQTTAKFEQLAKRFGVTIILSLFEERAKGLYHNTVAVVNGQEGYAGKYRKMHIPDDPRYYEKFYFTPGDLGFCVFETEKCTIGTLICWDQWFPEAARLTAMQGADILFYPTAIGWHPEEKDELGEAQHEAWEVTQRAHAIANGCFVVAVNRMGFEPDPAGDKASDGILFWGQTFVVGPDGRVLYRASADQEAAEIVRLDLNQIGEVRHGWPFFRDRRIDAYTPLTRRFIDAE